jgi:hypothetical protein
MITAVYKLKNISLIKTNALTMLFKLGKFMPVNIFSIKRNVITLVSLF